MDEVTEIMTRILDHYDLDMYSEGYGQHRLYVVRVWDQGDPFIECTNANLVDALKDAELNIVVIDSAS